MAEELGSKLGFDVSAALSSLTRLKREFEGYSADLLKVAGSTDKFNTEQAQVDKLLIAAAAAAEKAAGGLSHLATAQVRARNDTAGLKTQIDQLVNSLTRLSVTQSRSAASLGRVSEQGTGPLAAQVADRAARIQAESARLQTESDARSVTAFNEKVRFAEQLRTIGAASAREQALAADAAVRNTFKQVAAQKQANVNDARAREVALRNAFRAPKIGVGEAATGEAKTATGAFNEIGISYKGLLKIFATQIAFAAVGSFISAMKEGSAAAADFEIQLGQIQTISEEFRSRGLNATADAVRELSDRFGQPIEDVASGLYETLSNQVGNATESVQFLTTALTFSKGAVTSTADAVDLLSGIMNAYGLTAASAQNISDQLFVTIDKGRVKGEELANTFGRVAPLAAQMGISLEEVNTALAALTIQGVKPSDALTQLTNVMLKLAKPTEALKAVFDSMGIASAEAGIAIFGFDGFLREIAKTTDGTVTELGTLFNQIRGTRGVIGIVSRDSQQYADTLREISEASREVSRSIAAANIVMSTPGQQFQIELNKVKNFVVNDFGRSVVGAFNFVTENFISATNAVKLFGAATIVLTGVLGGAGLIILLSQVTAGLQLLQKAYVGAGTSAEIAAAKVGVFNNALLGTSIILGGLVAAFVAFQAFNAAFDQTKAFEAANDAIREQNRLLAEKIRLEVEGLEESTQARKQAVTQNIALIAGQFAKIAQATLKDKENAIKLQTEVTTSFKDQLGQRERALNEFLRKLETAEQKSQENVKKIREKAADRVTDQGKNRFERDTKGQSEEEFARQAAARIQKLNDAARRAAREGGPEAQEEANKFLDEAFDLANRIADSDKTRARGEGIINKLLNEQRLISQDLVSAEESKASAAAATASNIKSTVLDTKAQIDEFNKLQGDLQEGLAKGTIDDAGIKKIEDRLKQLGPAIQANLKKIGTANIPDVLGLQDIQEKLLQPFVDPFTKQLTSLQGAANSAMTAVIATLNKTADAQPVTIKLLFTSLTGKEITGLNAGEAATGAAQLGTEVKQGIENEKNLPSLREQVGAAQRDVDKFTTAIITNGQFAAKFGEGFIPFQKIATSIGVSLDAMGLTDFNADLSGVTTKAAEFGARLRELQNKGVAAALAGDAKGLAEVQKQIGLIQTAAAKSEGSGGLGDLNTAKAIAQSADALNVSLKTLADAQAKLREAQDKAARGRKVETAINEGDADTLFILAEIEKIRIKNAEAGAAFDAKFKETLISADAAATTFLNDVSADTKAAGAAFGTGFAEGIAKAQQEAAKIPKPTSKQARGGPIHFFADGGFTPRGTDTVPAMLSPGEFVVNAASTRKFYSDLVAINSGIRPAYRAAGGPVSNTTNVGDVVINVPGNSGPINGRRLASELRRELRRGTSRLRKG